MKLYLLELSEMKRQHHPYKKGEEPTLINVDSKLY